ncbi:MAG: aminotransferase class I/II-fold pyridoxal phosphate-dependent enzyme, partial [Planctomycetales bacterium]
MSNFRPEIQRMFGYVPGEQTPAEKVIKLNTNENPYTCSAQVVLAIESVLENGLARYPDPTALAFRQHAAGLLGVEPDWIMTGNGSDDILTIVTRAYAGQGDRVRIPYPSYVLYHTIAQIQGASSEEVCFTDDWKLPPEFSEHADRLKLAYLPNPNSPSGTMIPPDQILEISQQLPCPLLVDEAYVDFAETNCLGLLPKTDKILICRSFSKSYSLAGLRFGYVVAQPHVIENLRKV